MQRKAFLEKIPSALKNRMGRKTSISKRDIEIELEKHSQSLSSGICNQLIFKNKITKYRLGNSKPLLKSKTPQDNKQIPENKVDENKKSPDESRPTESNGIENIPDGKEYIPTIVPEEENVTAHESTDTPPPPPLEDETMPIIPLQSGHVSPEFDAIWAKRRREFDKIVRKKEFADTSQVLTPARKYAGCKRVYNDDRKLNEYECTFKSTSAISLEEEDDDDFCPHGAFIAALRGMVTSFGYIDCSKCKEDGTSSKAEMNSLRKTESKVHTMDGSGKVMDVDDQLKTKSSETTMTNQQDNASSKTNLTVLEKEGSSDKTLSIPGSSKKSLSTQEKEGGSDKTVVSSQGSSKTTISTQGKEGSSIKTVSIQELKEGSKSNISSQGGSTTTDFIQEDKSSGKTILSSSDEQSIKTTVSSQEGSNVTKEMSGSQQSSKSVKHKKKKKSKEQRKQSKSKKNKGKKKKKK